MYKFSIPLKNAPEWTPDDGPDFGIWIKKQRGSRCIWSVNWATSRGIVKPWPEIESMSELQLFYEAWDVVKYLRSPVQNDLLLKLAEREEMGGCWPQHVMVDVGDILRQHGRVLVPEFVWPADPPKDTVMVSKTFRPGWAPSDLGIEDTSNAELGRKIMDFAR